MTNYLEIKALKQKILNFKGKPKNDRKKDDEHLSGYNYLCNEILEFEYKIRGLTLPSESELIKNQDYKGALKGLKYNGIFRCLFKIDFKNFYPSIVREYDLQPSWDKYNIFKLLVSRLIQISDMDLSPDERKKIKLFMVHFCYGFLAYRLSPFCDREFAGTVVRKGKKIMRMAIDRVRKIQPATKVILIDTDGFIVNIEKKNFDTTYIEEAKRITNGLNKFLKYKHIKLKFEGFYTEGRFYNVHDYYLYNEFSREYIRKPNTRPINI